MNFRPHDYEELDWQHTDEYNPIMGSTVEAHHSVSGTYVTGEVTYSKPKQLSSTGYFYLNHDYDRKFIGDWWRNIKPPFCKPRG